MHVFDITIPGDRLNVIDDDARFQIHILLRSLETCFIEANTALNLFDAARREELAASEAVDCRDRRPAQAKQARISEIQDELRAGRAGRDRGEAYEEDRFEAQRRYSLETWENGGEPPDFAFARLFLFARGFVSALDHFDRILEVVAKHAAAPTVIVTIYSRFVRDFPALRDVRNSMHHLEDRIRGLGRNEKRIPAIPYELDGANAVSAIGHCGNLYGSKFGTVLDDGGFGHVDVSAESMSRLHVIFQDVLNAFTWVGDKQHRPSAARN